MKSSTKAVQGWLAFSALTVLTIVEFWLSSGIQSPLPYLIVIALVKAGLIIHYFMHVSQLWAREEQHS